MDKFYGKVGYAAKTEEVATSVWQDVITEHYYYGDVIRNERRLERGEHLNDDLVVNNQISIISDPYATENFFSIRYVEWMGTSWIVTNVNVLGPRLLLTLGGVYHG
jgi:hypothetical protein